MWPKRAEMAPRRTIIRLAEALSGSKQAQNCANMPRKLPKGPGHDFWAKTFWTILGPKTFVGFRVGAPNSHTSAHRGSEKVFLETWDGGV